VEEEEKKKRLLVKERKSLEKKRIKDVSKRGSLGSWRGGRLRLQGGKEPLPMERRNIVYTGAFEKLKR